MTRSEARTLTVCQTLRGPFPRWIPEATGDAHPICGQHPLRSGGAGLQGALAWPRPGMNLPVSSHLGAAPGVVGFREGGMLRKSLRGKGEPVGLRGCEAVHLTGSLVSPGSVGLRPHPVSCGRGVPAEPQGPLGCLGNLQWLVCSEELLISGHGEGTSPGCHSLAHSMWPRASNECQFSLLPSPPPPSPECPSFCPVEVGAEGWGGRGAPAGEHPWPM